MKRWLVLVVAVLAGCAAIPRSGEQQASPYRYAPDGSVIWGEEFQFDPPPQAWRLMQVDKGDEFSFAFLKPCSESGVCAATFAFDEEPFGDSRDLGERMQEFYARFLWAARVHFGQVETQASTAAGGREALTAVAEGRDEVKGRKVMTKVVLTHRGERVVAFYLTQWRSLDGTYDPAEVKDFDAFVDSFRFIRPSFFETL
ncbi:MAG: hypothetical protein IH611_06890 [Deltaproteobacteria bacterium]|nr:hypothetical protein [Deltaproteobacteria bacterium]